MSESIPPITINGKKELEEEMKNLLQVERPKVIKAIEDARSLGDLSENADYDAAKERQGWIEARMTDIQGTIAGADVINPAELKSERIVFGATVKIMDTETEEEFLYQIVGAEESDVKKGKISVMSPIARALIGKVSGDAVEVSNPKGVKEFEIIEFKFI